MLQLYASSFRYALICLFSFLMVAASGAHERPDEEIRLLSSNESRGGKQRVGYVVLDSEGRLQVVMFNESGAPHSFGQDETAHEQIASDSLSEGSRDGRRPVQINVEDSSASLVREAADSRQQLEAEKQEAMVKAELHSRQQLEALRQQTRSEDSLASNFESPLGFELLDDTANDAEVLARSDYLGHVRLSADGNLQAVIPFDALDRISAKSVIENSKKAEVLKSLESSSRSFDSDRNKVRSRIASGGWNVIYGELVNEAEYAKLAASVYTGSIGAYFSDYLERTIEKMVRTAPDVGKRALKDAIRKALKDRGRSFRVGKIGVKGGIATYRRWKYVSADVPTGKRERYKIYGPFGSWTYGWRPEMKRVKKKVPGPNHHQPYVAFRIYSSGGGNSSNNRVSYVIKLSDGYNKYKTYKIDGESFKLYKGRRKTHKRSVRSVVIKFDELLGKGKRYTSKRITPGTYEFRRRGNHAYLVKM